MWFCREEDLIPKAEKNSVIERSILMREERVQKRRRYNQFPHNRGSECCAKAKVVSCGQHLMYQIYLAQNSSSNQKGKINK